MNTSTTLSSSTDQRNMNSERNEEVEVLISSIFVRSDLIRIMPQKKMELIVNLASYRKEDWKKLINSADDKETMHDTWDEWRKAFMEMKLRLEKQGLIVNEVIIDIEELIEYCRMNGLKNTGKTRSEYVSRP